MTRSKSLIKAVLFDFDGTLTLPGAIDFAQIKALIGCPAHMPILEFIQTLEDGDQRRLARETLERHEKAAAESSRPDPAAGDILRFLSGKGIAAGLITRNSLASIRRALAHFDGITLGDFAVCITRDDPIVPKPAPDGVLAAAEGFGVAPQEVMVVGDFHFDILAGNRAGAVTVWLDHGLHPLAVPPDCKPDHTIGRLADLLTLLPLYLPLPVGKFPNAFLEGVLKRFPFEDPSVIINPGIGEDIAAVDVSGEEVLILKSDPITFATDAISQYAVLVNANDIATSGAAPRWMLTTLLFPPGSTAVEIDRVITDLEGVCRKWGITLCGGHTEITDAVTRPVIAGALAGTVRRGSLVDKRNMRPGDIVLITKGVAVEGTSIMAREFGERLSELGMPGGLIQTGREYLSHISILSEARIAAACPGTSAMHDVTEGGLATALDELSIAGGHRIRVLMENIPVLSETVAMCALLDLNPLGVIGSGSLLVCCRPESCQSLITDVFHQGIPITVIGEVLEPGSGIDALAEGRPVPWPRFETDEIARLFAAKSQLASKSDTARGPGTQEGSPSQEESAAGR